MAIVAWRRLSAEGCDFGLGAISDAVIPGGDEEAENPPAYAGGLLLLRTQLEPHRSPAITEEQLVSAAHK